MLAVMELSRGMDAPQPEITIMSARLVFSAFAAASLLWSFNALSATPASGELNDETGSIAFGGGPFVLANPTPATPDGPLCGTNERTLMLCDVFALKIALSPEFREENTKTPIQVSLEFAHPAAPATAGVDYDLYLVDSAGNILSDSASDPGVFEVVTAPLSVMKDGDYEVWVIPFLPLGSSYTAVAQIGRGKSAPLEVTPAVAVPGQTLTFDARGLASVTPADGYRFDFGDGRVVTDADGLVEHAYTTPNQYRATVTGISGQRGTVSAAQTIVIQDEAVSVKGSGLLAGGFGLFSLLSLFGLAGLRKLA